MAEDRRALFKVETWWPALEKYGAVTHLTVLLYDEERKVVCGPVAPTPLFALLAKHGYDPGMFNACASECLAQATERQPIVFEPAHGLAVVGTPLQLEGMIVGAAVAGYALVDFSQSLAIERLARRAGVPFPRLWDVVRQHQPVPARRLILHGELLQVLGDALLRENYRTRQYEGAAARLHTEMAAKDEFLAVVSHELRTPLTPILSWAAILRQAGEEPANRLKAADSIERNALLQVRMIDDLLDLNRGLRNKLELDVAIHDLTDVVRSTLDTLAKTAISRRIDIELVEPGEPLAVVGDAGRLQQIFVNILSNALKFTPPMGSVRVTLEKHADAAVVRIADTGEGIVAEFLPHVFEMFRQQERGARRMHSGLGIGLALVKRLVELHRGRVEVASAGAGCGTEVTVSLPLTTEEVGAPAGPSMQATRLPLRHRAILLVEDMEDSLETTRLLLETLGARVRVARDGLDALRALVENHPDLVLCDLRMPRMDGFEFLRELDRAQGDERPPVIALTGFASEFDHERTRAAGFEAHLDKPFNEAALLSVIESTLDRAHAA